MSKGACNVQLGVSGFQKGAVGCQKECVGRRKVDNGSVQYFGDIISLISPEGSSREQGPEVGKSRGSWRTMHAVPGAKLQPSGCLSGLVVSLDSLL